jgi:hypothetical protein
MRVYVLHSKCEIPQINTVEQRVKFEKNSVYGRKALLREV